MAEVPGSRLLSKRPRGYVPDDVAARRRVDGLGQEWEEEGAAHAPAPLGGTESVVAAALAAEAAAKASRQGHKGGVKPAKDKKSVSFAHEDEDELPTVSAAPLCATPAPHAPPPRAGQGSKSGRCEGGAASRRKACVPAQLQRRRPSLPLALCADIGDTELLGVSSIQAAEERGRSGGGEEEGPFEPFNLDAEREGGHFDEDGHYVEGAGDADAGEDAWLEGVEVDEAQADKCRRQAELEASKPATLPNAELGRMKLEIAQLLLPGESVLRGLKRMSGQGQGLGRGKAAAGGGRGAALLSARASALDPAQRAAFDRLTELSSTLMAFGEYDVYSFSKESFERDARALGASAAPPADMFADEEDEPLAKRPALGQPQPSGGDMFADDDDLTPAAAPSAPSSAPDFAAWSVPQLRRLLESRGGGDAARGAVEKPELRAAAAAVAAAAQLRVPLGYAWHAPSGLYTSAEAGLGFDLATGAFCDITGRWSVWSESEGAFKPWTA